MLNQCQFIGRLGADPEQRATPSGKTVTSFRLAVSEKRGGEEKTEWVSCVCWEKTAEFVGQYMQKGNLAYVSGKMQTRKWKDQSGIDRYTTEIIASTVQNLSPRADDSDRQKPADPTYGQHGFDRSTGEEVPF